MNNQVTGLYKVCSCGYCNFVSANFLQITQRGTNLHFQRLSIKTWHIAITHVIKVKLKKRKISLKTCTETK